MPDIKEDIKREEIMKRWDAWRKYIADGGKASWPRDEFECLIDYFEDLIKERRRKNDL